MLPDTISQLEHKIESSPAMKPENRAELLDLLGRLRGEIEELSKTHQEQAQSIAGFTDLSMHEATRENVNARSLEHSVAGLNSSVGEFEKSHPQLVAIVNRIATMLSNMGV